MTALVSAHGPLRIHWEVPLVAVGVGVWVRPWAGLAFLLVVLAHELGHAAVGAALSGSKRGLRVQLGSGEAYLSSETGLTASEVAVLFAGVLLGGPLAWAVAAGIDRSGGPPELATHLRFFVVVWSGYQLVPFPVTDGGVLLRRALEEWLGAVSAWRVAWAAGGAAVVVATFYLPLSMLIWLVALALVLGRNEAAHVRALDAYYALEQGRLERALDLAMRSGRPKSPGDRLAGVGLHAALELESVEGVEALLPRLAPTEPRALDATIWLLRRDRDAGGREAERVHDHVDAARGSPPDPVRYADLCFYHAIHEAARLRPESALGLLERAATHGFDDRFRVETEGAFDRLRDHPRLARILRRLRA